MSTEPPFCRKNRTNKVKSQKRFIGPGSPVPWWEGHGAAPSAGVGPASAREGSRWPSTPWAALPGCPAGGEEDQATALGSWVFPLERELSEVKTIFKYLKFCRKGLVFKLSDPQRESSAQMQDSGRQILLQYEEGLPSSH